MRRLTLTTAALALCLASRVRAEEGPAPAEEADPGPAKSALKSPAQKWSYLIGTDIGKNLKRMNVDIDLDMLVLGAKEAMAGKTSRLKPEEVAGVIRLLQAEGKRRVADLAARNLTEGQVFLAANTKKPGVITTASGLQYQVLKEGQGASPATTDTVSVHYRGTLLDGTEFDSSIKRKEPATFAVNRVIKGWIEGLQLMKVGGKTKFWVPSELAYGRTPRPGGPIGPNAMLIFEVELLEIEK